MMNRKRTNKPNILEQIGLNGPSDTFSQPIAWKHTFYLGPIEEPSKYYEWCEMIRSASPNDQVVININSPGGNYATSLQLRRAMMESEATVVCCVEGECHSAASIIFLSADAFSVSEGSNMLIHDYSGIVGGKGSEMIRQIQHEKISIDNFLADVYQHFLTEAEIKTVLSGQDMWLDDSTIMERTENMAKARMAEYEEIIKQEEQAEEALNLSKKKSTKQKKGE